MENDSDLFVDLAAKITQGLKNYLLLSFVLDLSFRVVRWVLLQAKQNCLCYF